MKRKARVIAFYLPQFHPIPENDQWWGKGFTEWTNVGKAKPLFKGHYQPRVPADLGYYDLRVPEVREAQAEMARDAGIEGFCYWHYWFGNGKRLLERPFDEVLKSGKPDFPFCLGWANHTWKTSTWAQKNGMRTDNIIAEQLYPGREDYKMHFDYVLEAFKDPRYIKVDGKPLFVVFSPNTIPNCKTEFIAYWQELSKLNGLPGIHFVGYTENTGRVSREASIIKSVMNSFPTDKASFFYQNVLEQGFDALCSIGLGRAETIIEGKINFLLRHKLYLKLGISKIKKFDYNRIMEEYYVEEDKWENVYPSLIPQWDRSPRALGLNGIYVNSTPENFKCSIKKALRLLDNKIPEHRILFLKSWNEWAEGNYVEPDLKYGHGYLEALKETILA